MPRPVVDPVVKTVTNERNGMSHETTDHPAFGQITANRVSGHTYLYGSDFDHNGYVTIRIKHSQQIRDLSHEWYYSGKDIVEVALSEAQWATFVSSMNAGDGTPCTVDRIGNEAMPALPPPRESKLQYEKEAKEAAADAVAALERLRGKVEDMKIPARQKTELLSSIATARGALHSSIPFILSSFGEHAEKIVERAKVEVNAYATRTLMRLGLGNMVGKAESPVELGDGKDGAS